MEVCDIFSLHYVSYRNAASLNTAIHHRRVMIILILQPLEKITNAGNGIFRPVIRCQPDVWMVISKDHL